MYDKAIIQQNMHQSQAFKNFEEVRQLWLPLETKGVQLFVFRLVVSH
jgi:hypothetical protein